MGDCFTSENSTNVDEEKYPPLKDEDKEQEVEGTWYGSGGWLPDDLDVIHQWRDDKLQLYAANKTFEDEKDNVHPVIREMAELIASDTIIGHLCQEMIAQEQRYHRPTRLGAISSIDNMLLLLNGIRSEEPQFVGEHLIGVPVAALFTGVNATLAGESLFRLKPWNDILAKVLNIWGEYLDKPASFPKDNAWLSESAQKKWNGQEPTIWIWPSDVNPYWNSWNDFFGRQINRKYRATAQPENKNIITCCNDGYAFRRRSDVKLTTAFWLKNLSYSLSDIFGPELESYAKQFEGGHVFQTFLSPYSYHRWWAPVSGTIKVVTVIPGYYASKRVLPDFNGATTSSLPYLLQVNSRGIVIIDTGSDHIGLVCCIPIGMVDVSSIRYPEEIKPGKEIKKGEELGHFAFGGSSSFAIIFEDVSKYKKSLTFKADHNLGTTQSALFPVNAPQPNVGGGGNGISVSVGMQIGVVSTNN